MKKVLSTTLMAFAMILSLLSVTTYADNIESVPKDKSWIISLSNSTTQNIKVMYINSQQPTTEVVGL